MDLSSDLKIHMHSFVTALDTWLQHPYRTRHIESRKCAIDTHCFTIDPFKQVDDYEAER